MAASWPMSNLRAQKCGTLSSSGSSLSRKTQGCRWKRPPRDQSMKRRWAMLRISLVETCSVGSYSRPRKGEFQTRVARKDSSIRQVRDAEPLGCVAEINATVDAPARDQLQALENAVGHLGPEPPGAFGEEGVVAGPEDIVELGPPVLQEQLSVVCPEPGVDRVLVLDREVLPAEQVVVGVAAAHGCAKQGELGTHDADAAPVNLEARLDEVQRGAPAAALQCLRTEGCIGVEMHEDVVPAVIQQGQQDAQLLRMVVGKDQVCMSRCFHLDKVTQFYWIS